jgi:hypothetical protein
MVTAEELCVEALQKKGRCSNSGRPRRLACPGRRKGRRKEACGIRNDSEWSLDESLGLILIWCFEAVDRWWVGLGLRFEARPRPRIKSRLGQRRTCPRQRRDPRNVVVVVVVVATSKGPGAEEKEEEERCAVK